MRAPIQVPSSQRNGIMMHSHPRRRSGRRTALWISATFVFGATLSSCNFDKLLSVDPRSRIAAGALERPENAQLLLAGAIGDFECAAGAYVALGGLIGEELDDATQTADRYPYDQRVQVSGDRRYAVNACDNLGVYTPLQTARSTLDNLLRLLDRPDWQSVPGRDTIIATTAAYSGYAYLLLGEGFCSMAVSYFDAGQPVYGGEISRDSVFRLAEARFTSAIAAATTAGMSNTLNMALVGRARARLNLGLFSAAEADAALVPPSYQKFTTASTVSTRRNNQVWAQNSALRTSTSVGAPYRNLNDPRVPVTATGRTSTTGVPLFRQDKYAAANSPIRIASGDEARLIVAESQIRQNTAGSLAAALITLNQFRAAGNQAPLVATDQATLLAELIDQRRRALFLEGQHLGDIIRYNLTLVPAAGSPFPGGGTYGSEKCLPLPDVERLNNPAVP